MSYNSFWKRQKYFFGTAKFFTNHHLLSTYLELVLLNQWLCKCFAQVLYFFVFSLDHQQWKKTPILPMRHMISARKSRTHLKPLLTLQPSTQQDRWGLGSIWQAPVLSEGEPLAQKAEGLLSFKCTNSHERTLCSARQSFMYIKEELRNFPTRHCLNISSLLN